MQEEKNKEIKGGAYKRIKPRHSIFLIFGLSFQLRLERNLAWSSQIEIVSIHQTRMAHVFICGNLTTWISN